MNPPSSPDAATEDRRLRWTFFALGLIYFLSANGRIGNSDASTMLELSRSLLDGRIDVPPLSTVARGPDGHFYSQYGLLTSMWWVPFVFIGRTAAALMPQFPAAQWEEAVVSFAGMWTVLALLAFLARAWRRCGADGRKIRQGVWLFGLATILWPYAKSSMSDPMMALCLVASYVHANGGQASRLRDLPSGDSELATATPGQAGRLPYVEPRKWDPWLAGLWVGLALLTRKQAQVIVPFFVLFYLLRSRNDASPYRSRLVYFAGLLPPVLLQLLYNTARWGGPFREVYGPEHGASWFSSDPAVVLGGAWRALFGEYAGLFVFNPILVAVLAGGVVSWWRRDRLSLLLVAVVFVTQALFIGSFSFGHGAFTFGSRFLLLLVPLLGLGWAHWDGAAAWRRWLLGGTAALGLMIQFLGVTTDPLAAMHRRDFYLGPTTPILWAHFEELQRTLGLRPEPPPPGPEATLYWTHPSFQVPDFWWCHLARQLRAAPSAAAGPQ
jgi:hypothetical protein